MSGPAAGRLHAPLIAAWDHYWFGGIAAVRPYLLVKVLLCVLAFDGWLHRVPAGGQYGAGGFGVAHFQWLDALQPLPSPGLYVGLMLAVGLLALWCAFTNAGRWPRALLAVLYTYAWAMSFQDGFQHHYFLSLVLMTFVFFPRLRARDLFAIDAEPAVGRRRRARPAGTLTVSSWGYALLGVNIGIVYAYTAVTKWDTEWRAGGVLRGLGGASLGPIAAWLAGVGVPPGMLWAMQGLGVFALECLIAAGFALAVVLDQRRRPWLRTITWLAFLGAVSFHVLTEVALPLQIGWFSYYMIVLACVYLLPSSLLWKLGALVYRPATRLAAVGQDALGRARLRGIGLTSVAVIGAAGVVVASGRALDLPGAQTVSVLAASALVAASVILLVRRRPQVAFRHALATGLAAVLMWAAAGRSGILFLYHARVGVDLQRRGDSSAALGAFERARRYAPNAKALDNYMARLKRQLDRAEE
ncbi:MAG TPA: HTTM domain-containing protein [Methylomirabilota bacterium]|nr:HTTM domain-containing protein [Methylomirabilota bacterium]